MLARTHRRKPKHMDIAFPKPSDIEQEPLAVHIVDGGIERCNKMTAAGRAEYRRRIRLMWERQGERCCLEGYIPQCLGYLRLEQATFEHEWGRGMGGAIRDDRIELPDGTWINGASHSLCNTLKGSRRIQYNASRNDQQARIGA